MMNNRTDFTILQAPVGISFECPVCEGLVNIPWREVDVPEYWGDRWPDVQCPYCGEMIELGEYDMD